MVVNQASSRDGADRAVAELAAKGGKASYYEVLEAQQQLFPTQLYLARTRRDQQLVVVALYKALGGGWQNDPATTSASTAPLN